MLDESTLKIKSILVERYTAVKANTGGVSYDLIDSIVKEILKEEPSLNVGVVLTAVELFFTTFNEMSVYRLELLKKSDKIFVEGTAAPVLALRINAVASDAQIYEKKNELLERYFLTTTERFKGTELDKKTAEREIRHIREDMDALKEFTRIGTHISPATQSLINSLERLPSGGTTDGLKALINAFASGTSHE